MNADELKSILQEATRNQTRLWEGKMAEWKIDFAARQDSLERRVEQLTETVREVAFAAPAPAHSLPRAMPVENRCQPLTGCNTGDQQEPPAPSVVVVMLNSQTEEESSGPRTSMDADCQLRRQYQMEPSTSRDALLVRQSEKLGHYYRRQADSYPDPATHLPPQETRVVKQLTAVNEQQPAEICLEFVERYSNFHWTPLNLLERKCSQNAFTDSTASSSSKRNESSWKRTLTELDPNPSKQAENLLLLMY